MGCTTANPYLQVTSLQILNGIPGTFPPTMGSLPSLQYVHFGLALNGTLPSSWSALTALGTLKLTDRCAVSGPIPASWSSMVGLRNIEIPFVGGEAPFTLEPSFYSVFNSIILTNAALTEFPSFMGSTNSLTALVLNNVQITSGTIPAAVWENSLLERFVFTATNSSDFGVGTNFPVSLSSMTSLTTFTVAGVGLGGSIPASFPSVLDSFALFSLDNLEGSIPQSLLDLPALTQFTLNMTSITGGLPELTHPSSSLISWFDVKSNPFIVGFLPSTWAQVPRLQYLNLSGNGLTGEIPQSYATGVTSTSWKFFSAANNQLNGTLPSLRIRAPDSEMDLTNCGLTGAIPLAFGSTLWADIKLSGNSFNMCANAGTSEQGTLSSKFAFSPLCALDTSSGRSDCDCLGTWPDSCFADLSCPPPTAPVDEPIALPVSLPTSLPVSMPVTTPTSTPESIPTIGPISIPSIIPTLVPTGSASSTSFGFGILIAAALAIIFAF